MKKLSKTQKLTQLREELKKYEDKLSYKMRGYRGVIHESAQSELRHSEVMVLQSMVRDLKQEIENLENS